MSIHLLHYIDIHNQCQTVYVEQCHGTEYWILDMISRHAASESLDSCPFRWKRFMNISINVTGFQIMALLDSGSTAEKFIDFRDFEYDWWYSFQSQRFIQCWLSFFTLRKYNEKKKCKLNCSLWVSVLCNRTFLILMSMIWLQANPLV